ncbi:RNA 2',3'-cyclic phosphodiesterase [Caldinitratiruptor microaerophilus]|uniref:RNA 2',3'-cyclic phosphodiesterase n=1 Tax=Caldinitratiruptor microaerophilus TaxID=671077 RepID=A0AA35G7X0_9FIRM|nr:RNA 2',3'-cyclic phosphodiesterase [Caldinitratiruptor microaerophilus]BDG60501.1 RNA 2',3'-cyclic phosphodiesterase [Caldinitratiruptor microaerophilus]
MCAISDKEAQPIRTFVAVPVHSPALVAALESAQATLRQAGVRARWVRPGQFHFTLKFLGEIPASQVEVARAALERAVSGAGPFDLEIAGLGAFPRPDAARVLWAGCGDGGARLIQLAFRVESALVAAGFPPEPRPFTAHLTLGRLPAGGSTPQVAGALRRSARPSFGRQPVTEVVLYRSDLRPDGPVYTPLSRFPL